MKFICMKLEITTETWLYAYFHRVREAAMTSLMEVTLLLTQNEPALIDANMYVALTLDFVYACCFVR